MMMKDGMKPIEKNKFASCIPLISANKSELLADVEAAVRNDCDFLEWRRDYFMKGATLSRQAEIDVLKEIKRCLKNQGIIYTYRSHLEGGVFETSDAIREAAINAAIESDVVDYVDVELASNDLFLDRITAAIKNKRPQWIASHHNFERTPAAQEIRRIYASMEARGADVLKLALMPHTAEDVRRLMMANLFYNEQSELPMIAIAMGALGGITRIAPDLCGGSLTYAAGAGKTAPGQINLEGIRAIRKEMGLI
ncbi:type I 3-dehydroquinate dehydratase [Acetobacterium fimetarium]|uniref:3-dehydroquinate dehydratase n=1 Tax=Acetobacterium fimetarium TaxID=52691 RepID=A0ABR6WY98_9FIRM|nr:type I 3-dehydroquinate dehydratase [Acetobacterium fimetarium]MBC3805584.1 type I 3-dehydroquinate dehydratase [Acetobacterium fimetarium]